MQLQRENNSIANPPANTPSIWSNLFKNSNLREIFPNHSVVLNSPDINQNRSSIITPNNCQFQHEALTGSNLC